jgi:hypothetical protein
MWIDLCVVMGSCGPGYVVMSAVMYLLGLGSCCMSAVSTVSPAPTDRTVAVLYGGTVDTVSPAPTDRSVAVWRHSVHC